MQTNWPDDFKALYRQKGQAKYGIRLFALWKIQSGMTETAVCELIGKTRRTTLKWRRLYEAGGITSLLQIQKGRGRKAKIEKKETFEEAIKTLTKNMNGGRIRAQDIVDYFAEKHAIHYSLSGMYRRLHKLGYSWITSRSKHPKQNPEIIKDFKKKVP